jgi:hypothetical protein
MKQGEPWWPHCVKCTIKHILGAEGHIGEAIDRCAREYRAETLLVVTHGEGMEPVTKEWPREEWLKKIEVYANILNDLAEIRKRLEKIYYTEEILVEILQEGKQ